MRPLRILLILASLALVVITMGPDRGQATGGSTDVAAGGSPGSGHTCAVTSGGGVKCWGFNDSGQLGDGTTTDRSEPVDVAGLTSGVVAVTAGTRHTCALTTSGGLECWGSNFYGQLGDGTATERHAPVAVSGLTSGVAGVSAGSEHTCALTNAGGVKCWGINFFGELGDGTNIDRRTPVDVSGLTSGVMHLASGGEHNCVLLESGFPNCWGWNDFGQLGDGTETDRNTPVEVSGISAPLATISAGDWHTCAVSAAGSAQCWGDNNQGQLGEGTNEKQHSPRSVCADAGCNSPLYGILGVAAGHDHTCALTGAGGLLCWGENSNGQVGDGTTTDRSTPVGVAGLATGVDRMATGSGYTCAVTSAGGVRCWGENSFGQIGDGTTNDRSSPADVVGLLGKTSGITGDVNCDGEVSSIDAALILQLGAGLVASLPCQNEADVNQDGRVDAIDASLILQFAAGLIAIVQ